MRDEQERRRRSAEKAVVRQLHRLLGEVAGRIVIR